MFVKKADGTTTKNKNYKSGVKITRIIIRSKLRDRRHSCPPVIFLDLCESPAHSRGHTAVYNVPHMVNHLLPHSVAFLRNKRFETILAQSAHIATVLWQKGGR